MTQGLDGRSLPLEYQFMFVRVVQKNKEHVSVRVVENFKKDGKVKQRNIYGVGYSRKDDLEKIEMLKRVGEKTIIELKNEIMPALKGFEKTVHAPIGNLWGRRLRASGGNLSHLARLPPRRSKLSRLRFLCGRGKVRAEVSASTYVYELHTWQSSAFSSEQFSSLFGGLNWALSLVNWTALTAARERR